jgi:hypothetical protein
MREKMSFEGDGIETANNIERGPKKRKTGTIEFFRHEVPGVNPETKMSADYLTPEGKQRAAEKGQEIKTKRVKAYASPKMRAQETGDLGLQNVDEGVKVINREMAQLPKKLEGQKPENKFIMRAKPELDVITGFAKVVEASKSYVSEQQAQNPKKNKLDCQIQYYLDHAGEWKAQGVTEPEEVAQQTAYRLNQELKMIGRLNRQRKDTSDLTLQNFSHGPKLEPFLQRVMLKKDGRAGFDSLDEIGGSFNPGEKFAVDTEIGVGGQMSAKLLLRGEEYGIDLNKVAELAKAYEKNKADSATK